MQPTGRGGRVQLALVLALLVVGGAAWLGAAPAVADAALALATVVVFVPASVTATREVLRGHLGVDLIALLAMAGALLLGELLAGAIIALMLSGGETLEAHAAGRARRELTALLRRAPRVAHRQHDDGTLEDLDVERVVVGVRLLVKPGEVVPTDGLLLSTRAILDASALTGEARPVELRAGEPVQSGTVNAAGPLELRVTTAAASSTYAGIVRLVEEAATQRPPFVRMADRYAAWFLPVTLALAAAAWGLSGDPIRALAVVVVATPCPLILAAPAAIVGGLSRAARGGIIVKGGAALEALAGGEIVLLDKTGTVTAGRPTVTRIHPVEGVEPDEVLRLAASLEQMSVHPFAPAVVAAATRRGVPLSLPSAVHEELGVGIAGRVGAVDVGVGQLRHASGGTLPASLRRATRRSLQEGSTAVHVSADGRVVGTLVLTDRIRPETPSALRRLRRAGIRHVWMVTGDRADVADLVAETVGVDRVLAERAPAEKVAAVLEAAELGRTIMVGDGINDAPALALADVGVAMGARGATAASEAADVVLTSDRLGGLAEAVGIARRTRRIALQSVIAGMGMSIVAMIAAAVGLLPPVAGALVQEAIDVAVILNALRTLRAPRGHRDRVRAATLPRHVLAEHADLRAGLEDLATVGDHLPELEPSTAAQAVARVRDFLVTELLPHELEEERTVYPVLADLYAGEDPTPPLIRAHREIARRIRLFARTVDELPATGPEADEILELQRSLWTLQAVLDLHMTLEDELYAELLVGTGGREVPATSADGADPIGSRA